MYLVLQWFEVPGWVGSPGGTSQILKGEGGGGGRSVRWALGGGGLKMN